MLKLTAKSKRRSRDAKGVVKYQQNVPFYSFDSTLYEDWENMKINEFFISLTTEIRKNFCRCDLALTSCCACNNRTPKSLVIENKACDNHMPKQNIACVQNMAVVQINLDQIFFQRVEVSFIFSAKAFFSEENILS